MTMKMLHASSPGVAWCVCAAVLLGWQIPAAGQAGNGNDGFDPDANGSIPALGRATGGQFNGSSGLIEAIAQVYRIPAPRLAASILLAKGAFQFTFTNDSPAAFTVIGATDAALSLATWEILGSPAALGGGIYRFTDAGATNYPRRYYGLRWP